MVDTKWIIVGIAITGVAGYVLGVSDSFKNVKYKLCTDTNFNTAMNGYKTGCPNPLFGSYFTGAENPLSQFLFEFSNGFLRV